MPSPRPAAASPSQPTLRPVIALALLLTLLALLALASAVRAQAPTFEDQVMEIVNQERWNNGQLPPLKRQVLLDNSAEGHSDGMAVRNFFAHCDLDNHTQPWDRMTAAGYTGWAYASENIAAGYTTPAAVMAGWMASSGHRANMLSTNSRELGIGYIYQSGDQNNIRLDNDSDCAANSSNSGPYRHYWTQNFGRRNNVYPVVVNREAFQSVNSTVSLYMYGSGWATQMRFRNEGGAWSSWQPYSANATWVLSPGNGTKTVNAEITNGSTTYSSSDQVVLNASADLAVTLGVPTAAPEAGQDMTYHFEVTNSGTSDATGITLVDVLPTGMAFQSASAPVTVVNGTLSWSVALLASGGSAQLDVVVRPASGGSYQNTVDVAAGEFDPALANNSATIQTDVAASQTGVADGDFPGFLPVLALRPNVPNPFQGSTRLAWSQREPGRVRLTVHDVAGRVVTTLADDAFDSGDHSVLWNARDDSGRPMAAGLYLARLEGHGRLETMKLLVGR